MLPNRPIFIVDDDDGHAHLIELNLRQSGVGNPFQRFSGGREVLDEMFGAPGAPRVPALMLLDLNMPGVDGHEVLETIRRHAISDVLPIIVLTTTDEQAEIDLCYQLGCNLYVTKPVHYEDFTRVVRLLGALIQSVKLPSGRFALRAEALT